MIDNLLEYNKAINGTDEISDWIKTTGLKSIKVGKCEPVELEHIIDYLNSNAAPKRLRKMSYKDAKRKADEWETKNRRKGRDLVDNNDDIEVIHDFFDGTKIVKLKTNSALKREGFLMSHCVGGYNADSSDYDIYSYRDVENNPHATFEVRKKSGEIVQIKGKGNGNIHPKYINPILAFLKTIGMDIRPNDMKNLGYYVVDKSHRSLLEELRVKTVALNGINYVVDLNR